MYLDSSRFLNGHLAKSHLETGFLSVKWFLLEEVKKPGFYCKVNVPQEEGTLNRRLETWDMKTS